MLLEVLSHSGFPPNAVLSIRAGGTRRQLQCSHLDSPLKFPCGGKDSVSFKVDVLDLVGTARFAYNPSVTEYTVKLDNPIEGGESTNMQLVCGLAANDDDACQAELGQLEEKVGKKEDAARDYLDKHGLTTFMQFLMHSLMKDKPADPYTYLQKQVTKRMVSEVSKTVAGDKFEVMDDKELESLLAKVYTKSSVVVTTEQLELLAREAAAAGDQLRADKERLRETTEQLKTNNRALVPDKTAPEEIDTVSQRRKVSFAVDAGTRSPLSRLGNDDSPEVAMYREIARMQEEVSALARENTGLVMQLSDMRTGIDTARGELNAVVDSSKPPA